MITGGIVAVAVLVVVLVVALSRSGNTPQKATAAANNSARAQQPSASALPSQASVAASQPPTSGSTPLTVAAPTPTSPVTASEIDFRPVAGFAHLPQIASILDTYFSGINAHNGGKAASVFAPNGAINPHDSKQVALFSRGISTTHDDEIAVESIKPATFAGEAGLAVRLRFRSRQNASLGPHNETCTDWSLTQKLVGAGNGYRLLGSERVDDTSC